MNDTPYMKGMNRRSFIQSLVAVFSLPANPILSLSSATAAIPTAMAVPARARSWAVYISSLHGECTPQTLQNLLHIREVDAKKYIIQLIADGVIKPNPLLQRSVSKLLKTNDDNLLDKVKKRLEMKARTELEEMETCDTADTSECLDAETELLDELPEDEQAEIETYASSETDFKS
ncbi:MAG: hypothetical protein GY761_19130 [Hyphomicrobiales bacterium]|nr:hypothetical protein [Hyphomicrobiales bacterium]